MHSWRPWIVLCLTAACASRAAVIYKWTDADRVVHYSDQSVPGAEKIIIGTTAPARSQNSPAYSSPGALPAAAKKGLPARLSFTEFAIDSPASEATFTGDAPVNVHLRLRPVLNTHQTIAWHLNGKQLDEQAPDATQFTLQNLARGSYVLAAMITDQETGESLSSDAVSFYVHQPSKLSPQHKKP